MTIRQQLGISLSLWIVLIPCRILFAGEISTGLQEILPGFADDDFVPVLVSMQERLDVQYLSDELTAQRATRAERHRVVITAAQELAERTQPPLRAYLADLQAQGVVATYESYWITNAIYVEIQKQSIADLAAQPGVGILWNQPEIVPDEPVSIRPASHLRTPGGTEPGLRGINAPRVWNELGLRGEGRLVSNVDTGVNLNHPALNARWRGNFGHPANECWYGAGSTPSDNNGHGTHTMGTICGLDPATADTIGVAPAALWIAAESSSAIPALEWIADPDGNPETIDDVPDVSNNSWSLYAGNCPAGFPYYEAMDICEAAGVVLVWSSGNARSGITIVPQPKDRAETPFTGFCVGATTTTPPFTIASFSLGGPTDCEAEPGLEIKPEVSAPGVDVRSAYGSSYSELSGTSMSAPHVAGVVALMRQADPNIEVNEIKEILMLTAIDLGPAGEDNDYGHGFIDAYAAVMEVYARMSAFQGTVTDAGSGEVLRETRVFIANTRFETLSDENGFYHLSAQPGTYTLQATRFGYYDFVSEAEYTIASQETLVVDIELEARPQGHLSGMIASSHGYGLANAEITPLGVPVDPFYTGEDGQFSIDLAGDYTYTFWVDAPHHDPQEVSLDIPAGEETEMNLTLTFVQSFEENNGDFIPASGFNEWEWGTPQAGYGPAFAYSGDHVWGTDLDGMYEPNRRYSLETRSFNIGITEDPRLVFYTWYDMDEGWDGGLVQISTDNGETWLILPPEGGYPDNSIVGLGGQPGFTGESEGWQRVEFPLLDYLNQRVKFRFRFGSTNNSDPGWFFDNFAIYGATDFYISVEDDRVNTSIHTPAHYRLNPNYPNPFNPKTTIRYELPVASTVSLAIYTNQGQLVRTLVAQEQPAGSYAIEWDGRLENGERAFSGIYYYRLVAGDYEHTRSMVLLK